MKKILFISGARPNLVKLAPLYNFIKNKKKYKIKILHTNQHSNKFLFGNICIDLNIPKPNFLINKVNAKNNITMISYFMEKISIVIDKYQPNLIIVFGDVDTTLAAAITSKKKQCKILHVEAGLRSKDFNMQEEVNRKIVDHLSDINFCTSISSLKNLSKEGLKNKSYFVGNIIFDNYLNLKAKIDNSKILQKLFLKKNDFILITIHRYQLINYKNILNKLCNLINHCAEKNTVVFTCHSRTKTNLKKFRLIKKLKNNIKLIDPLSYTDFSKLLTSAKLIITDSGGVHEESYYHSKKCLVLRNNFEREDLINNKNVHQVNFNNFRGKLNYALNSKLFKNKKKIYWDGKVSNRIYKILKSKC